MEINNIGFSIIYDFISSEEEQELINNFNKPSAKNKKYRNSIQRFGSSKPYNSDMVSQIIPDYFDFIIERLIERKLVLSRPQSVTINQYLKGQSIVPHVDSKASGKVITVLSLLNEANMIFEKKNSEKHSVLLPARCLTQMKDEIRNLWKHSIEPVDNERYSVVFRCAD